jgi:hypothetical protein
LDAVEKDLKTFGEALKKDTRSVVNEMANSSGSEQFIVVNLYAST